MVEDQTQRQIKSIRIEVVQSDSFGRNPSEPRIYSLSNLAENIECRERCQNGGFRIGKVVDEMVLNIDLAPTLLDFAGVPVPKGMQGRSARPLLEGRPAARRTAWFYEYFRENGFGTPTVLAVRTEDAKLIKYPGHDDWTELFDLRADPYETRNLARGPDHKALRDRLEDEFDRQAKAANYRVPPYADEAASAAN